MAGPATEPLPPVAEAPTPQSSRSSISEEDLVAMSKSASHIGRVPYDERNRTIGSITTAGIEWVSSSNDDEQPEKIMIAERLETVKTAPLCSCW